MKVKLFPAALVLFVGSPMSMVADIITPHTAPVIEIKSLKIGMTEKAVTEKVNAVENFFITSVYSKHMLLSLDTKHRERKFIDERVEVLRFARSKQVGCLPVIHY
jgi:hypothetical protein